MSPQAGSSMTTTTQRRSTRESSGTCMPIFLIYLISLYDDEEGLKSLHIILVPITHEEEPKETFAPTFDVLVPNPQEGDHEARNTLEIVFLNQLGTQPRDDISKNYFDTGEQE
jgi:hypothetical protein